MKNKKSLALMILWMSLGLISYFGVLISIKLNVSYHIEQFFWFLSACSLVLLFSFFLCMTFTWFKQNKNTFRRIGFFWFWSLLIGTSLLLGGTIFWMYLKSLVSINTFDLIMELKNFSGIILFSFIWIGIFLMFISIILVFFSPVKEENNIGSTN